MGLGPLMWLVSETGQGGGAQPANREDGRRLLLALEPFFADLLRLSGTIYGGLGLEWTGRTALQRLAISRPLKVRLLRSLARTPPLPPRDNRGQEMAVKTPRMGGIRM